MILTPNLGENSGTIFTQIRDQQLKISQLEDELSALLLRRQYANPTCTINNHRLILELTAQLFPQGKIIVSEEADPEIEDDNYFVITVQTPGTVDHLVECHREWHHRVSFVAPETANAYRLSIDIND